MRMLSMLAGLGLLASAVSLLRETRRPPAAFLADPARCPTCGQLR